MEDLGILAAEKTGFFVNGGVSHGKCEMGESPQQPWHLVSESSTEEVQQRQKRSRKAEIKWMRDGAGGGGGMAQDPWGLLSCCLPCMWNLAYSAVFHGSGSKQSSVLHLVTLDGLLFNPLFLWIVPSLEPQYSILEIVLACVRHNAVSAVNT